MPRHLTTCACGAYRFDVNAKLPELRKCSKQRFASPLIRQLYHLQRKSGVTQEALAEKIGVSHTTLSTWFSGRAPTLVNFDSALNALGYTLKIMPRGPQ